MTKYYSPSVNAFYSLDINGTSIPEDAVEITDEAWLDLLKQQSEGKVIAAGMDGLPEAQEPPPLTQEQLQEIAENQRKSLINTALQSINVIQLKLQAGRALTDTERLKLDATLDYIDAAEATDISNAPDITWPYKP